MMNFQQTLNNEGLRLTQPRKAVMSILEAATTPLSPQIIYQRALESHTDIGLVTVYRTLELLTDLNLVKRVHGHDECHGYVLASPGHHHHIICRQCGKAVEFTGTDDLSNLLRQIKKSTGFKVDEHLLQLQGLCPQCQKENQNHAKNI